RCFSISSSKTSSPTLAISHTLTTSSTSTSWLHSTILKVSSSSMTLMAPTTCCSACSPAFLTPPRARPTTMAFPRTMQGACQKCSLPSSKSQAVSAPRLSNSSWRSSSAQHPREAQARAQSATTAVSRHCS
ncbi:hypothetical protein BN1723_019680, partial [Verticillium longisporum]